MKPTLPRKTKQWQLSRQLQSVVINRSELVRSCKDFLSFHFLEVTPLCAVLLSLWLYLMGGPLGSPYLQQALKSSLLRFRDISSSWFHVRITPARGLVWAEFVCLTTLAVLSPGALPRSLPDPSLGLMATISRPSETIGLGKKGTPLIWSWLQG